MFSGITIEHRYCLKECDPNARQRETRYPSGYASANINAICSIFKRPSAIALSDSIVGCVLNKKLARTCVQCGRNNHLRSMELMLRANLRVVHNGDIAWHRNILRAFVLHCTSMMHNIATRKFTHAHTHRMHTHTGATKYTSLNAYLSYICHDKRMPQMNSCQPRSDRKTQDIMIYM